MSFSLARRIYTIVEDKILKEALQGFKKKTLLEQKYPELLIKASILKAK